MEQAATKNQKSGMTSQNIISHGDVNIFVGGSIDSGEKFAIISVEEYAKFKDYLLKK